MTKQYTRIAILALTLFMPLMEAHAYYWDGIAFMVWRPITNKGQLLIREQCPTQAACTVTCSLWKGVSVAPVYGKLTTTMAYQSFSALSIGQFPDAGDAIAATINQYPSVQFCMNWAGAYVIPAGAPGVGQTYQGQVSFQIDDPTGSSVVITAQGGAGANAPKIKCQGTFSPPLVEEKISTMTLQCDGTNLPAGGVSGGFVGMANCGITYLINSAGDVPGEVTGAFKPIINTGSTAASLGGTYAKVGGIFLSPCKGNGYARMFVE